MSYGVVYKITNKQDGMCYIGKTTDVIHRFSIHKQRFPPEDYTFEILAKYDSSEELNNAETYWMWRFKALKEGYNKKKGYPGKYKFLNKILRKGIKIKQELIDDVKVIGANTHYITIPIKICQTLGIKKGDKIRFNITEIKKGGKKHD